MWGRLVGGGRLEVNQGTFASPISISRASTLSNWAHLALEVHGMIFEMGRGQGDEAKLDYHPVDCAQLAAMTNVTEILPFTRGKGYRLSTQMSCADVCAAGKCCYY